VASGKTGQCRMRDPSMRGLILAAGRGSRMAGETDAKPKCLVPLQGQPLLQWQISSLRAAGVQKIGIVTGYRREMLAQEELTEFHNPRWAETQMVFSLICASSWLESGPCVVSYSDIFYEPSAVTSLSDSKAAIAITYSTGWLELWKKRFGDPLADAETFRLNADSTLAEIGKKPKTTDEIQGQYMGLLRFLPEGWLEIRRVVNRLSALEIDRLQMTTVLQMIIKEKNCPIEGIPFCGKWGEVDRLKDLIIYEEEEAKPGALGKKSSRIG